MNRRVLTQLIRAKGGKLLHAEKYCVVYAIPLNENDFISFREKIPFLNLWHGERDSYQHFVVFFGELMED